MRRQRLDTIRERLLGVRQDLLAEIKRRNLDAAALIDEGVPDVADQGLTDNLKEFLHLLSDSKREEIVKVDEALDRLGKGEYGICEDCGKEIDIGRLELRPYTRHCTPCKNALEKAEAQREPGKGLL